MSYIFFIVKGSREDACRAILRRNLSASIDGVNDAGTEVYCSAPRIDKPIIIGWFCEPNILAKVSQPGDCLFYTERGENDF